MSGRIVDLSLNAFNDQDVTNSTLTLDVVREGDLIIRDLAYMHTSALRGILQNLGDFLCRLQANKQVYQLRGKKKVKLNFSRIVRAMTDAGIEKFEDRVFLDQDLTLQVRLFVYLLPESVYQERMRKANLNAQKKGRQIGKEFKARVRLNLFITSTSEEVLDIENAWKAYTSIQNIMSNRKALLRSTFKHAFIYSLSGLLAKAVGFIMLPVYAHYIGAEGYGVIGMVDVVLSVLVMLIGYGFQTAMSRMYFEREDIEARNSLVSTTMAVVFLLVSTLSCPLIFFGEGIAQLAFGREGLGDYITLAVLTFIADMTGRNAESYIYIRQRSLLYAGLSILRLALGLTLNIVFIVQMQLGVLGYLYSSLIVAVVFSFIMHGYALACVGFKFNPSDAREVIAFSLPLVPGYIAMLIRTNTDRIMIRTFLGLSMLGVYEMLFKFATLIGFLVTAPLSKIWNVKRFEIADTEDGPFIIARGYTLQLALMLFIGLLLSVEIPVILQILTPPEFWIDGYLAGLAVASRIILASYYHFFFGLVYAHKTHRLSQIQYISTVANVIFCLLLIKPFGILGAVLVSCLTNAVQCLVGFRFGQAEYQVPYEWRKIVFIVFWAIMIFIFANKINISQYDNITSWIHTKLAQPFEKTLLFFYIDGIRDGKIVHYAVNHIPLLVDGALKFITCTLYLLVLVASRIIPTSSIVGLYKLTWYRKSGHKVKSV